MNKFEVLRGRRGAPARLAKSRGVIDAIAPAADAVLAGAKRDPSATYAEAVYKRVDRKRRDRAAWIITLPAYLEKLAQRVEAKRGTMRRASRGA